MCFNSQHGYLGNEQEVLENQSVTSESEEVDFGWNENIPFSYGNHRAYSSWPYASSPNYDSHLFLPPPYTSSPFCDTVYRTRFYGFTNMPESSVQGVITGSNSPQVELEVR